MTEGDIRVTTPELRELAAEWARQLDTLAAEMYAFIAELVPEARADDEIAGLTLASCSSNIEDLPKLGSRPRAEKVELAAQWAIVGAVTVAAVATGHGVDILVLYYLPACLAVLFLAFAFDCLPHTRTTTWSITCTRSSPSAGGP